MATTVTEGEPRESRTSSATSMRWQGKLATAFKEAARRSIISSSSAGVKKLVSVTGAGTLSRECPV